MAELEAEFEKSRSEIATYLHEFADKLESGASLQSGTGARTGTKPQAADTRPNETTGTGTTKESTDDSVGMGTTGTSEGSNVTDDSTNDSAAQSSGTKTQKVTMLVGNESATINPPETLSFDVAVDSDSSLMDSGSERSVTFVLRWASDDVEPDDELSVH